MSTFVKNTIDGLIFWLSCAVILAVLLILGGPRKAVTVVRHLRRALLRTALWRPRLGDLVVTRRYKLRGTIELIDGERILVRFDQPDNKQKSLLWLDRSQLSLYFRPTPR